MAVNFDKLSFTKDWKNASDFPTYEENETQVRADMQALHDETRDFINDKLIPSIESMAVPGAGDMLAAVYDTAGQRTDVYAYATAQANAAKEAAAGYTNEQLAPLKSAAALTPGPLTLFQEFRTAGTYTVTLPADAVFVYALAVGAGGGGAGGTNAPYGQTGYGSGSGGGGGAGGNARFIGPILASSISDFKVVVGAGGTGGAGGDGTTGSSVDTEGGAGGTGGASSVLGFSASGGGGGAKGSKAGGTPTEAQRDEYLGAAGGNGGGRFTRSDSDILDLPYEGKTTDEVVPFTLLRFSAGGGGAGVMDSPSGCAGGVCGLGSGGHGGNSTSAGSNGGQCCGGGGGGSGNTFGVKAYAGGKGGDGYVAIWIQRSGITE